MAKTSSELLPNLPEQDNPFDKKTAMSTDVAEEQQEDANEQPKDYANGATGLLKDQEKEVIEAPELVAAKAS
jgi:uncharacterized membrane-anchored protein YhcB (DUF1043 family)